MLKKATLLFASLFLTGCNSINEIFVEDKSDGTHDIEETESITKALDNTYNLSTFKLRYDIKEGDLYSSLSLHVEENKLYTSELSDSTNFSSKEEKYSYLSDDKLVNIASYKVGEALFASEIDTSNSSYIVEKGNFTLETIMNFNNFDIQLELLSSFSDDDFEINAEKNYLLKEDSIISFCENYNKNQECLDTMETFQIEMHGHYINSMSFHGQTFHSGFSQFVKVNLEIYNVNKTEVSIPEHTFDGVEIIN